MKSKKTKKNRSSSAASQWVIKRELSPSVISYNGPLRHTDDFSETTLSTAVLMIDGSLTSDSSGVIAPVYNSNPNSPGGALGALANFPNFAASWDEYRVLAFEVQYEPFDKYNRGVSVFTVPIMIVTDYDSAAALTSYATADHYSSSKTFSLDVAFKYTVRMNGIENSNFISTASPAAMFYAKVFGNGSTVSTSYGKIFLRMRIQFRGTGI